jgi:hypothetical protein
MTDLAVPAEEREFVPESFFALSQSTHDALLFPLEAHPCGGCIVLALRECVRNDWTSLPVLRQAQDERHVPGR